MFTIAAETGWPEQQIMEMPTYRVFAYYWAALRKHGVYTVKQSAPPDAQIERLLSFARSVDIEDEE